jgi:hypothetical protein
LAAGWLIDYNSFSYYQTDEGIVVEANEFIPSVKTRLEYDKFMKAHYRDFDGNEIQDLKHWHPTENGGPIFGHGAPLARGVWQFLLPCFF